MSTAIEGRCEYEDSSELVSRLRLIKSDAELEYVRTAAALADDALAEAQRLAKAGSPEQDVLAGMKSAIFRGGGDYPASRFIIGSGENALMVRNFTGYGTAHWVPMTNCSWNSVGLTGTIIPVSCGRSLPENPAGYSLPCTPRGATPFKPARTLPGQVSLSAISSPPMLTPLDQSGFGEHRLNACGYSLGALYPPTWMDWPMIYMIYKDNPVVLQPNMVIFMHMILLDWDQRLAMSVGGHRAGHRKWM